MNSQSQTNITIKTSYPPLNRFHSKDKYRNIESQSFLNYDNTLPEDDYAIMNEAATVIQAHWSGYIVRKRLSEKYRNHSTKKNGISRNQSNAGTQTYHKEYKKRKDNIETEYFTHFRQPESKNNKWDYKDFRSPLQTLDENQAATTIQAHYKGYRTRKQLCNLREKNTNRHTQRSTGQETSDSDTHRSTSDETSLLQCISCKCGKLSTQEPISIVRSQFIISSNATNRKPDKNVCLSNTSNRKQPVRENSHSNNKHIHIKKPESYILEGIGSGPIKNLHETLTSSPEESDNSCIVRRQMKEDTTCSHKKIHSKPLPTSDGCICKKTSHSRDQRVFDYSNEFEYSPEMAREKMKGLVINNAKEPKLHQKTLHMKHADYSHQMPVCRRSPKSAVESRVVKDTRYDIEFKRSVTPHCEKDISRHSRKYDTNNYSQTCSSKTLSSTSPKHHETHSKYAKHVSQMDDQHTHHACTGPKRVSQMDDQHTHHACTGPKRVSQMDDQHTHNVHTSSKQVTRIGHQHRHTKDTSWRSQQPQSIRIQPSSNINTRDNRVFKTRKHYQQQKQAATVIQAHWKGYKTRQSLKEMHCAAVKIQSTYRGFRTRNYLYQLGVLNNYDDDEDENVFVSKYQAAKACGDTYGKKKSTRDLYTNIQFPTRALRSPTSRSSPCGSERISLSIERW
ncbi:IQ domain-containing protein N [Discoglossus pictus]